MTTLGIVGGIAPESTIDYYRSIVARYRAASGDGRYPAIVIDSIDLVRMLDLVRAGRLSDLVEYLLDAITMLANAGADLALLASNTPHVVFEELAPRSPIPLVSIVETVALSTQARGLKRVGLFGTRFTMEGRFYPDVLARYGVQLVLPQADEITFIHDRYMSELVEGRFLPETRARMVSIANRLHEQHGIDGLILGGTELPLALRGASDIRVPLLDSTALHVERTVSLMLGA